MEWVYFNSQVAVQTISVTGSTESKVISLETQFTPYAAFIDRSDAFLLVGSQADENGNAIGAIYKIDNEGNLIYSYTYDTTSEIYGAWSDSENRTYICGSYNGSNAFYALLSADGKLISDQKTDDTGYYESIVGGQDNPYVIGTVMPKGSKNVIGRVLALSEATVDPMWTGDIISTSLYTYADKGVDINGELAVVGYETNGTETAPMVVIFDKQGNITGKHVGNPVLDNEGGYMITDVQSEKNLLMTLTTYPVNTSVNLGSVSVYMTSDPGGIQTVGDSREILSTEYYDASGIRIMTPTKGFYIKVERTCDGRTRSSKIMK